MEMKKKIQINWKTLLQNHTENATKRCINSSFKKEHTSNKVRTMVKQDGQYLSRRRRLVGSVCVCVRKQAMRSARDLRGMDCGGLFAWCVGTVYYGMKWTAVVLIVIVIKL